MVNSIHMLLSPYFQCKKLIRLALDISNTNNCSMYACFNTYLIVWKGLILNLILNQNRCQCNINLK